MSIQGSKKETIFTLWQKKYPKSLEEIIGLTLDDRRVEISNGRKKNDLYAVNRKRRIEVFVENQLLPSDPRHLDEKVRPIIESRNEAIIVWTALRFHPDHIATVKDLIRSYPQKYISVYFMEIPQEIIRVINTLNSMYELDVWENLDMINRVNPKLIMVDKLEQIPPTHIGKVISGKRIYDYSRVDDVKEYLLEQLQERIPYFINFQLEKKHNLHHRILVTGGGRFDISYFCSVYGRGNKAYVEIGFGKSKSEWYDAFKYHEFELRDYIDKNIRFNDKDRKIGVYFKALPYELKGTVDRLVELFKRLILYFSPYTYGEKNVNELP
ncbi:hypothetical protein [Neobacillus drentensis]|uniref:hypothetical protein n=1 Tax=Neobacillus drentensis TaxID=220684 RepID=UPI002FFDBD29